MTKIHTKAHLPQSTLFPMVYSAPKVEPINFVKCNSCQVLPDIEVTSKLITLKCPGCGKGLTTNETHAIKELAESWRKVNARK